MPPIIWRMMIELILCASACLVVREFLKFFPLIRPVLPRRALFLRVAFFVSFFLWSRDSLAECFIPTPVHGPDNARSEKGYRFHCLGRKIIFKNRIFKKSSPFLSASLYNVIGRDILVNGKRKAPGNSGSGRFAIRR